jgi:hypothetical protein
MQIQSARHVIIFTAALLFGGIVPGSTPALADAAATSSASAFTVVAAPKDGSHPHFGEGSPVAFVVDGVQGRELILVRGKTYTFHVDTGAMHDFYLSSDERGTGIGTVADGVSGNFTYKGDVSFTPGAETPDLVYYACRNHRYMGGAIHVVNPGDEGKVQLAMPAGAAAKAKDKPVLDPNEVKQRLNFVDMYINRSESAKRIAASGNAEARAKYTSAQDGLAAAKTALAAGDLEGAKTRFDDALARMKEAAQLAPSDSTQQAARQRNADLVKGVLNLEASYRQNREAMASDPGLQKLRQIDYGKIHKMLDAAKALGDKGNWEDANSILDGATREISAALNDMLANKTISYDLKFASPAQEYDYELARYASYEELIPVAKDRAQPPPELSAKVEAAVGRGKEKRDQADAAARAKDFAAALENIKQATDQLKSALLLLGVG